MTVEQLEMQRRESDAGMNGLGHLRALLSCIRYREAILLQGPPCMGMVFSAGEPGFNKLPATALCVVAGFLLVAQIWVLNDWSDMQIDEGDVNKSQTVFSRKGISSGMMLGFSILLLALSLSLFALIGSQPVIIAMGVAAWGFVYSLPALKAKCVPLLSSISHFIGGLLHFLLGYSIFSAVDRNGVMIGVFFALVFTSGHGVQEVQDYVGDRKRRLHTNAVAYGKKEVFLAAQAGFVFAYCYLVYLSMAGVVPGRLGWSAAVLLPLHLFLAWRVWRGGLGFYDVKRFRSEYQAVFALTGLNMISMLFV